MDVFNDGCQYNLSSAAPVDHISVVHAKLTETAVKAFEEYHQLIRKTNTKSSTSTIRFKDNEGVIEIPGKTGGEPRTFGFTLSSIGQQNEQLQCIQQNVKPQNGCLESVGVMNYKLQVKGTNDSYQKTLARINVIDEESKKFRAKEIERGASNIGRRVKLKQKTGIASMLTSHKKSSSAVTPVATPRTRPDSHNTPTAAAETLSGPKARPTTDSHNVQPLSGPKARLTTDSHNVQSLSGPKARLTTDSLSVQPSTSSVNRKSDANTTQNLKQQSIPAPVDSSLSLRDRVVHLLALRAYKQPELILRLKKDGVHTDRNKLNDVLAVIAEHRRDVFTLHKHLYVTDVKQDWPLYTHEDRLILARKLQQVQEVAVAESPALSPCTSVGSRSSPAPSSAAQKRSSAAVSSSSVDVTSKRPRLSDYKVNTSTAVNGASVGRRRRSSTQSGELLQDKLLKDPDYDDYSSVYTVIKTDAERQRYKQEFANEYDEYLRLRNKTTQRLKVATELSTSLLAQKDTSTEYEKLKQKLFTEYKRLKADSTYAEERRHWMYLHRKLGHIKKRVHEYDTQLLNSATS